MKQLYLLLLLSLFCLNLLAQNEGVSINTTGAVADNSAMLDVQATDKGVLIPRLTTEQRNLLAATAATGLLVFDSDSNAFFFYDGSQWSALISTETALDDDWHSGGEGHPTIEGEIFHSGTVSIGHTGPAFGRLDVIGQGVSAIRAENINEPTNGYLAVIGSNQFDGITGLDLTGLEIGALGVSTGTTATDNIGVFGFSNWWGGEFQNVTSGRKVRLAGPTYPMAISDPSIADATNLVLTGKNASGGATWSDADSLVGWENNDYREINPVNDSAEVHIGVDWNGAIGDKLWIRATDSIQNPLRVQVWPGITRFYVRSNGGTVIGTVGSDGPARGLYVYQDQAIGVSNTNARLEVSNTDGIDRDTMIYVNQNSASTSGVHYGVRVDNNSSTTGASFAFYHERLGSTSGTRYGYRNYMTGGTGTRYGMSSSIYADGANTSTVYGLYSYVSGSSTTGTSYAGYFNNTGNEANDWSVYAYGRSYFQDEALVGSTTGATGYKFSVDGDIACEDILIEDSGSWPDYVFENDYELLSLDDFKKHIESLGHLPGVPSAEVIEEEGIRSGEMHKATLEKVEELSLYIIQLHERVKALEAENQSLRDRQER